MSGPVKVVALVGTYRKGGNIDAAVEEILAAARAEGAETSKIYLIDRHIEFCTNCRTCTQQPGPQRGECVQQDDMRAILDEIERSDAFVLAAPMNMWSVTAVTKRFIERMICFVYWPWGIWSPKMRKIPKRKAAVVVASSAAPAFVARLMTGMVGLLKQCAGMLGARRVDILHLGLAAGRPEPSLGERAKRKARRLGKKLVQASRV